MCPSKLHHNPHHNPSSSHVTSPMRAKFKESHRLSRLWASQNVAAQSTWWWWTHSFEKFSICFVDNDWSMDRAIDRKFDWLSAYRLSDSLLKQRGVLLCCSQAGHWINLDWIVSNETNWWINSRKTPSRPIDEWRWRLKSHTSLSDAQMLTHVPQNVI